MLHARHATTACSMVIALVLSGIAQQGGRRNLSRADSASNDLPTIIELTPKSSDTAARAPSPAKPEADSAASALPTQPAVEPEEPVAAHTETPPGRLPDFSLFDYRKVISVGPWLSYFYYNENIDVSQMVQWYRDQYGTPTAAAPPPNCCWTARSPATPRASCSRRCSTPATAPQIWRGRRRQVSPAALGLLDEALVSAREQTARRPRRR